VSRYFVVSMHSGVDSCCDASEAANTVCALIEDEGLDERDIWVLLGEEIKLSVKKPKEIEISFNGEVVK
jgi:hypothetical protein